MEIKDNVLIKITDDDIRYGTITIPNNVNYIGNEAFKNCKFLKHIIIPNSVEGIGKGAFENCINLKSIDMSCNINNIEGSAFRNCTLLTSIIIPKNVTTIKEYVFCDCKSLKNINIMGNLERIEENAFKNCESLKKLFISKGIKYIGDFAFYNCSKLNLNIETSLFNFYIDYFYYGPFKKLQIYSCHITYKQLIEVDNGLLGMKWLKDKFSFNAGMLSFINSARKNELHDIIKNRLRENGIKNIKYYKIKEHEDFINRLLTKIWKKGNDFDYDYMVEIDNYVNKYIKACVSTSNLLIPNKFINDNIKSIDTSEKIEDEIIKNDIINSNNANDTICEEMEVTDNSINSNQLNNNLSNVFKRLSELPSDDIALIRDMVKNDFFDENIEKYINMSREEKIEFLNTKLQEINKEKGDLLKNESQESGKPKVSLKKEPIEAYKERQKQLKKIN